MWLKVNGFYKIRGRVEVREGDVIIEIEVGGI